MADTSPARRPPREPDAAAPDDGPAPGRPLADRWWWTGVATALVGAVLIGFQWEVVTTGESIAANWVLVVIGGGIVVAGLVILWRDWQRHRAG